MFRATSRRPCRLDVLTCVDLLVSFGACTCCARTAHALLIAFGWVLGDEMCASTHLVGGSVPCGTERQAVPARRRLSAIARCRNEFLLRPLLSLTHTHELLPHTHVL